ncbi:MAG: radical SAM protein [Bacteroidota bacterium]
MNIILLNPRSAKWNHRAPLSLLALGAVLEGKHDYAIIDENYEGKVERKLTEEIRAHRVKYLGVTVMPGPQLARAVPISSTMKARFPDLKIIWGGTFPTIHTDTVLNSGYVDFVVRGQGEFTLVELIDALEQGGSWEDIRGISYRKNNAVVHNPPRELVHPDSLPPLPYHRIDLPRYLARTYLGKRTSGLCTSIGCPFLCGFCSVTAIYNGRWLAKSAASVANEVLLLKRKYGVDSIEFFDDNFFTSEKRVAEFCERIKGQGLAWWGEGRSDTLLDYSDKTLRLMRDTGCKMIYTGAESGSQEVLELMNKGGKQTPSSILEFADRIKEYGIIPEFSFILGNPTYHIDGAMEHDFRFIRRIKEINPKSEISFHTYAPVLLPGAQLFEEAKKYGFDFPKTLDEWASSKWEAFGKRKSPYTPWLKPRHRRRIRDFEIVLNAYTPTIADLKITKARRKMLRLLSGWRYRTEVYFAPYEIRVILYKLFRYRQPQIEGAEQYST